MLNIQLLFVFGVFVNLTLARPNEHLSVATGKIADDDTQMEISEIPAQGVVYGMIINFTSPDSVQGVQPFKSVSLEPKTANPEVDLSSNAGKLVRKKRFLFGAIGAALESFRSDNWRECGRTPWGTTIYTNGIATACFGACPEHVYCGYDYGYGRSQINTIYFG